MNHAAANRIAERAAAGEFAHGHWFCGCCQRITELDLDHECSKCVICGSMRVRWHDAKRDFHAAPANEPAPGTTARRWFAVMREAVEASG